MKYKILEDECIGCGACEPECPEEAIYLKDDDIVYQIDQEKCIECGKCVWVCPAEAIVEDN